MQHRKTLMLVLTALFAALTAIGAFFKIPFTLAAISLQFLFTAMAGHSARRGLRRAVAGRVCADRTGGRANLRAGRRIFVCFAADVRVPAGADPVGVRDWEAGEAAPDLLGDGACHAGRAGRSVCYRRAVYGADRERVSGQGADILAGHQERYADLSAGRPFEDRTWKLSMRRHHAAAAAGLRRGLISAFPL